MNRAQQVKKGRYTFVFWGTSFDETAAVVFTAGLRQQGLLVKVVGLVGPQAAGFHGVALSSDLTLSEALLLAEQAICVVLPCSAAAFLRIEDDPRVAVFLQAAATNRALFVVRERTIMQLTRLEQQATLLSATIDYASQPNLLKVAHALALMLKQRLRTEHTE
ncbi:MAG: hypothetical protein KF832_07050 [Caldilineaceae bacterium]|nr:hypothetical protein [Caldilineaceae bacterium]